MNRRAIAAAVLLSMAYANAGEAAGEPRTGARWELSFKGFGPVTVPRGHPWPDGPRLRVLEDQLERTLKLACEVRAEAWALRAVPVAGRGRLGDSLGMKDEAHALRLPPASRPAGAHGGPIFERRRAGLHLGASADRGSITRLSRRECRHNNSFPFGRK